MGFFTNDEEKERRMSICRSCPHFTKKETCGTPVIGDTLEDGRKTCGCFMKVKTSLQAAKCPLAKWGGSLTDEELKQLKNLVKNARSKNVAESTEIDQMFKWAEKISGKKIKRTRCPQCVQDLIRDLWNQVKDLEDDVNEKPSI